jgi:hypothetical protein
MWKLVDILVLQSQTPEEITSSGGKSLLKDLIKFSTKRELSEAAAVGRDLAPKRGMLRDLEERRECHGGYRSAKKDQVIARYLKFTDRDREVWIRGYCGGSIIYKFVATGCRLDGQMGRKLTFDMRAVHTRHGQHAQQKLMPY